MRLATGLPRLDELLKGGVPEGNFALVYGPPYIGKELLARHFYLTGRRQNTPSIFLTTNQSAADLRTELTAIDPEYSAWEANGGAWFIDTYSRAIGAEDDHPYTRYVDGPLALNDISLALNDIERNLIKDHASHRLIVDSVSTLVAYINAQTAFRFLQVLIGKTRRAGGTGLVLMDEGMHAESEVQMFKHLMNGVVQFRSHAGKTQLHVLGVGIERDLGWLDYTQNEYQIEITGSFAAGRIR